jgi:hypothetical protein
MDLQICAPKPFPPVEISTPMVDREGAGDHLTAPFSSEMLGAYEANCSMNRIFLHSVCSTPQTSEPFIRSAHKLGELSVTRGGLVETMTLYQDAGSFV